MINFNQIVAPLELVIVQWVATYPLTTPIHTLHDLTNAEFFLHLLHRIKHFTFLQHPTYTSFIELTLTDRLTRMKLIGRSILHHLNSELAIDTGQLQLNYLQMCKGNREQSIRMVILLLATVTRNPLIQHELEQYTATCTEDSAALFNIMVDYASKIGQGPPQTDSPEHKEKRLITRLEVVEEQVEFYQDYTRQLQTEIETVREQTCRQRTQLNEFQLREKTMLVKLEQLEQTGEQYAKEISLHEQRELMLNSRINNNRQVADEVVDRLTQQLQHQKTETHYYKTQLEKYTNVEAHNRDLINANNEYRADLQATKLRLNRSLEAFNAKQTDLRILQDRYHQLSLETDGLRLKLQLMQKSYGHNDTMHYSPQQKSITCHHPLSQSFSGSHAASPLFSYQTRLQELNDGNELNDSLTITHSNYVDSKTLREPQNKQNVNSFNLVNEPGHKHYMDEIHEERSVELTLSQLQETTSPTPSQQTENDLLMQIVFDLYQHLEFLKSEVNQYRLSEAKKAERKSLFMKKVNRMFS